MRYASIILAVTLIPSLLVASAGAQSWQTTTIPPVAQKQGAAEAPRTAPAATPAPSRRPSPAHAPAASPRSIDRAGALSIGDVVVVHLPGEAAFNKDFAIGASGSISLPEVGEVRIAGMSVADAQRRIRLALANAYRDLDQLRVVLKERRLLVEIGGFVKKPGTYNLPGTASVQSAIAEAGGLAPGAQMDRLQLRRGAAVTLFDYKRYLETGDPELVPRLRSLDTLFVPSSPVTGAVHVEFDGRTLAQAGDGGEQRSSIKVFGEVNTPATYAYKPGATVVDMLLRAGGVTRYATVEQIRLLSGDKPVVFNLQAYLDSGDQSLLPPLVPGMTIFVPKQIEEVRRGARTVYVMGEVARPGAFETKDQASFIDILANAGGPTRFAETRQIRVLRAAGTVERFDLVAFTEGKTRQQPKVGPGDAIFVPEKIEKNEPSWLKVPPSRAIHVIGAVNKPGRFEWSDEMSLFDLLAQAGGPKERADIAHIEILRHANDRASSTRFDLAAFLKSGGSIASVPKLKAGYVIMVPELPQDPSDNKAQWTRLAKERSIYIMGAVGRPGRYAFNRSLTFLDILAAADGPTEKADLRNIRISHRGRGAARVSHVNLARYFATGDDHLLPRVRVGDVIFVPDRNREWLDDAKETTVRVLGAVAKPGRYRFTDDMTILDLLAEAGGPTPTALLTHLVVINMGRTNKSTMFDMIHFAKTADITTLPVVRAGDTIFLPQGTDHEVRQTLDFLKDVTGILSSATGIWTGLTTKTTTTTTTTRSP
ncbi:MAG: SLBB domain-containing protein [Hyphomicrobiaceae bacterium]